MKRFSSISERNFKRRGDCLCDTVCPPVKLPERALDELPRKQWKISYPRVQSGKEINQLTNDVQQRKISTIRRGISHVTFDELKLLLLLKGGAQSRGIISPGLYWVCMTIIFVDPRAPATDDISRESPRFFEFSSANMPRQFSALIVCCNDGGYYFRTTGRGRENVPGRCIDTWKVREKDRERESKREKGRAKEGTARSKERRERERRRSDRRGSVLIYFRQMDQLMEGRMRRY